MEIQFSKLGLIPPEGSIPPNIRNTFQLLWANNGDIISKQYAGTNALKVCNAHICSLQNLLLNNNIAIIFTIFNIIKLSRIKPGFPDMWIYLSGNLACGCCSLHKFFWVVL
jgi:hypothetical protein